MGGGRKPTPVGHAARRQAPPAYPTLTDVWRRTLDQPDWLDLEVSCADGFGLCSRSRRVLLDLDDGYVTALPCLAWLCPECQHRKWYAAKVFFARGIESARDRDERVRFVTLTDGTEDGSMTVEELSAAWDDLAKLLRRNERRPRHPGKPPLLGEGPRLVYDEWRAAMAVYRSALAAWHDEMRAWRSYLHEYAMVLEVGSRGQQRLHTHILMTGRFIHYRRLSEWASRCGFGRVADIREVKTTDGVAAYATKMAGYVSKAGRTEELAQRSIQRVRPVRSSRQWLPGGLRGVEEELRLRRPPSARPRNWLLIEHCGGAGLDARDRRWTRFHLLGEKPALWHRRPTVE